MAVTAFFRPSKRRRAAAWLALIALISLPACHATGAPSGRTFYVDFEAGSDQQDGASPAKPWKHAPGDPAAEGAPRRVELGAGDTILFKGGVAYRGTIRIERSGAEGAPITYKGEGYGTGQAILSGRDVMQLPMRACQAVTACAWLPDAAALRIIDLPMPMRPSDQIALGGRMLELAQAPDLPDAFWYDDLSHYQHTSPSDLVKDGAAWRMKSDFLRKALGDAPPGDLVAHVWEQPNAISSVSVTAYDPAARTISFSDDGLKPYPDKDGMFALVNHPALIHRDGQFATINGGRSVVVRTSEAPGTAAVEISRRGMAFSAGGANHLVIEGFDIQGYAGGERDWGSGSALFIGSRPAKDITFRNNFVHDLTSWAGAGAIHANGVTGLTVTDNRFVRLWRGAGITLGGQSADIRIQRNLFDHIGRTGINILGADRVLVDRNRLIGLRAHHGNGISVYLDNHDVLVTNNLIRDTTRAITFHGAGDKATGANRIRFRRNLLQAQGEDGSALQSWGSEATGIVVEGNVMRVQDGRFAMRLNGGDRELTVRGNIVDGLSLGGEPAGWRIDENVFTADSYIQSKTTEAAIGKANRTAGQGLADGFWSKTPAPSAKACAVLMAADDAGPGLDWLSPSDRAALSPGIGPDGLCAPGGGSGG